MVGDGKELTVGETQTRLNVSDTTVRTYIAQGLLRARWTVGRHARIDATSVDELAAVLRIPPGQKRDAALEELRATNEQQRRQGE